MSKIILICRKGKLGLENFIKEKGLVLKSKPITAYWLYRTAHKKIFEEHFNNLTKVDIDTFNEDTLVEVDVNVVDITLGSV